MSPLVANTITGIAFFTLILKKSSYADGESPCPIVNMENGLKKADCTGAKIKEIPNNLGSIQYLDVSKNTLADIAETAFSPYWSLIALYMREVTKTSDKLKIHKNAFLPLTSIEEIDLDGSQFSLDEELIWPPSLKRLTIASCIVSHIDVGNLKNLVLFNGSSTQLEIFPRFHKLAPLTTIDLQYTSIQNFTLFDLAPFCILEQLSFEFNNTEIVKNSTQYCLCAKLNWWLIMYQIKFREFDCTLSMENTEKCEKLDIEPACKDRRLCILRLLRNYSIVGRIEIGVGFVIILLLLLAAAKAKPVQLPKLADTHPFETPSTSTEAPKETKDTEKPSPSPSPPSS